MKHILSLLLIVFSINFAKAQIIEIKYLDDFNVIVDSSEARYKVIYEYTDSTKKQYISTLYDKNELYKVAEGKIEMVDTIETFTGIHKFYYSNGNIKSIVNIQKGLFHGSIKTYYKTGELKRDDVFENDSLISGKCYTRDGKDTTYYPYQVKASFPGGTKELMKFISKNVQYPEVALENGIQGSVFIRFIVDKFGCIEQTKIIKSPHWSFNIAAKRVIKAMPPWIPGYIDGEIVEMVMTAPIKFKLADDPPALKRELSEKELKKLYKKYR
jgi:TonB family protein